MNTPIYDNMGNPPEPPTHTPNAWVRRPEVRLWVYGILTALAPVGVAYGLITTEQGGLWLTLASAVLGVGNLLAARNTPKGR